MQNVIPPQYPSNDSSNYPSGDPPVSDGDAAQGFQAGPTPPDALAQTTQAAPDAPPAPAAAGAAYGPASSQPVWPSYPPNAGYPGAPSYPAGYAQPQSQPNQSGPYQPGPYQPGPYQPGYDATSPGYNPNYQTPPTGYPPQNPYYQQQYPYSNWTPSGVYPGQSANAYPNGSARLASVSDGLRRQVTSAREWGQTQYQRVREHPQSRYAAIALVLLLILTAGIGIGGALMHAGSSPTAGAPTIGASSPPITSVPPAAQDLQQTLITTVNAVEPSVVEVTSTGSGNGEAIGSGEILTANGYIVTNDHVVTGYSSFTVRLSGGQTVQATLVGEDAQDDLAVLKANLSNAKPIAFADSGKVQVGQFATALGSPLGLQDSVTFGIVSALNRTASEAPDGPAGTLTGLIQTSAPINPGNSGGALVDLQGQLIGIPTLGATDNETGGVANGIGFAIASNRVKYVSQQLIANGRLTSSGQGFLGIAGQDVSPQFGQGGGSGTTGVQIAGFSNDASGSSPAQKAGLQVGDIITAVDGQPVISSDDLAAALQTKAPGTKVTIQYMRGSSSSSVSVTLGERPASQG